jgi:hypothetical protein
MLERQVGSASVDVPGDDAEEGVGADGDGGVDAGAKGAAALVLSAAGRNVERGLRVGIHGGRGWYSLVLTIAVVG